MLAETLKEWTDGWFQEGLEQGCSASADEAPRSA